MSRWLNFLVNDFKLFAPETVNPFAGGDKPLSKDDIALELLDDEPSDVIDLEKPKKEPKIKTETDKSDEDDTEDTGDEKPEDDELEDLEQELEGPTEEQLELVTPVRRKEILGKYPQLFKDFPYLEKAYYREQQFTELLPTIEDAREAVEAKQVLDRFETDVMSGNIETILKAVKGEDPGTFNKIVDSYLDTIRNVDEQAHLHILGNVTKHTIIAMVQEANRSNNEVLKSAAQVLNQFVFGSSDFVPPAKLSKGDDKRDDNRDSEFNQRQQAFVRQQFETTRDNLNSRVNNALRNTIDGNIDPKKTMSDYVRNNATRDVVETLETLISQDTRFKSLVDKLWEKAFQDNFSQTSVDRIRSAFVSKSKTLLPSVIKKARNDALRGMGKRVSDDNDEQTDRSPVSSGRPRSQSKESGKITKASDIPKGMKTIDFLMQE